MTDRPMWCDDFDMDLPKVFPNARAMLGDVADIELWTTGSETNGTLNHPCVWNSDKTMLAFFGFSEACGRPERYVGHGKLVRCTVWEAFRDAWPHQYCILLERTGVWDTFALRDHFMALLYEQRRMPVAQGQVAVSRRKVLTSITLAVPRIRAIAARYPRRGGAAA